MPSRRRFLQQFSALFATGAISGRARSATPSRGKRIHLGAQTNAWGVPIKPYGHLLEVVEAIGGIGYQGFETNFASLQERGGQPGQARRDFDARHCRLIASHNGVSLFDKDQAETEIQKIRRVAGVTAAMGATYLIVSGRHLPHPEGKLDLTAVHAKMASLNRLGEACKEEGLKLCYHNHAQEFQDQPPEMNFLLKETDPKLVWLNLDVGHAYGVGPAPALFSSEHFRRIAIYHMKDIVRDENGKEAATEFGQGKIDLKAVVAPLLNSDWEGWLTVEREENYPHPADHPDQIMRQCYDYLKGITEI
jgi:sugar phosphate isomerase/epimerase